MAAKIKDGLFIGDADSSQDPEFLELNKIYCLINCAGRQIPNIYAGHGLTYKRLDWEDTDDFVLMDSNGVVLHQIVEFIETSMARGCSVLVFSVKGVSRCIACVTAYMMYRYHWSFEKTIAYMFNKRPDIDINMGFVTQLQRLDKALQLERAKSDSAVPTEIVRRRLTSWDPSYLRDNKAAAPPNTEDELVLVNSFINSQPAMDLQSSYRQQVSLDEKKTTVIRWDEVVSVDWLDMKTVHTPKHDMQPVRSILKGSRRLLVTSTVSAVAEDKTKVQIDSEPRRLSKDEPKSTQAAAAAAPLDPANSFYHLLTKDDKPSPQSTDIYGYVGLERAETSKDVPAAASAKMQSDPDPKSSAMDTDHNSSPKAQRRTSDVAAKAASRPDIGVSLDDLKFQEPHAASHHGTQSLEDVASGDYQPSYSNARQPSQGALQAKPHAVTIEDYDTLYGSGSASHARPSRAAWPATTPASNGAAPPSTPSSGRDTPTSRAQRAQRPGPVRVERTPGTASVPAREREDPSQARGRQPAAPVRARPASPSLSDASAEGETRRRVPATYRHGSPAPQGFRRTRTSNTRPGTPDSSTLMQRTAASSARVRPPSPARTSSVPARRLSNASLDSQNEPSSSTMRRAPSPSPVSSRLSVNGNGADANSSTVRPSSGRKLRAGSPMTRSASTDSQLTARPATPPRWR